MQEALDKQNWRCLVLPKWKYFCLFVKPDIFSKNRDVDYWGLKEA
jgi:hypothetical protein